MQHGAGSTCALLALPDAVLRELVSWSPDGASTHALLTSCRTSHRLPGDPSVAALLLLRCLCRDYEAALASCGCCQLHSTACVGQCDACFTGVRAVTQQVLLLLGAGPETGGPITVPPQLLQAILYSACTGGDCKTIRVLRALQQPPDFVAAEFRALHAAVGYCPRPSDHSMPGQMVQMLLDCGAGERADFEQLAGVAGLQKHCMDVLPLLLLRCPAVAIASATALALQSAVVAQNSKAVNYLLPLVNGAADGWEGLVSAAARGSPLIVQSLLKHIDLAAKHWGHTPASDEALGIALGNAAFCGQDECAALLLNSGADANYGGGTPLINLVQGMADTQGVADPPCLIFQRVEIQCRLLVHGAVVTAEVRAAARAAGPEVARHLAQLEEQVASIAALHRT